MKKILSLLLAMAMLLTPVLSLAEEAFNIYTAPDGSYGFAYPADWSVLTLETLDELIAASENEGYKSAMGNLRSQIEELGMIILMSEDMISNINIVPQDTGAEVTNEMVAALEESAIAELTASMEGITFPTQPSMLDLDDGRQALLVQYSVPLFEEYSLFGAQAYVGVGNTLFLFTMTSEPDRAEADAQVLGIVIGSTHAN